MSVSILLRRPPVNTIEPRLKKKRNRSKNKKKSRRGSAQERRRI
jgi:hypothetical protein